MKDRYTRQFLGEIFPFKENNKLKRKFHAKHLSAYLRGYERFKFGYDEDGKPLWYDVQSKIYKITDGKQG